MRVRQGATSTRHRCTGPEDHFKFGPFKLTRETPVVRRSWFWLSDCGIRNFALAGFVDLATLANVAIVNVLHAWERSGTVVASIFSASESSYTTASLVPLGKPRRERSTGASYGLVS